MPNESRVTRRSLSPGLQPDLGPLLDCIRSRGWRVATCLDLNVNDEFMTSWLFLKDGRYVEGVGKNDVDALFNVLTQLGERDANE